MKKIIILKLIFLILIFHSCKESEYKEAIIDSYESTATEKNITLKISNIDVLKKYDVGNEYFQELIIEGLNSVISDNRTIISLLEDNILIYNQSIKEKTESDSTTYYSKVIDSYKFEISKAKKQINIVKANIVKYQDELKKTELDFKSSQSEQKFLVIKHYLQAELNNKTIKDTIESVFDSKLNFLEFNPDIFDIAQ